MPTKTTRESGQSIPKNHSPADLPNDPTAAGTQWLQTLAAISPAAIYRADTQGHCTWVNEKWSELTGRPFEAAIGKGWRNAIHPDDLPRLDHQWQRVMSGEDTFICEYRYLRPDGKVCWVLGRAAAEKDEHGKVIGFIGITVDVTELREAHSAIKDGGTDFTTELTSREREVAVLLAEGKSNKQVAARLGISVRTAEAHRARIMRKLRVGSLAGLVKFAMKSGLIGA